MANSTKAERQALRDAKGEEPKYDGSSYYNTAPSQRQTMSIEEKIKDLGYQPGVFASAILDIKGSRLVAKNRERVFVHKKKRLGI